MSTNDITGDRLTTKVPSKKFLDNFDGIFRKKKMIFDTFEQVEGMNPCIKKPIIIHAKQINEAFEVDSLEGNYKKGKAGDYLMTGIEGEHYICDKEIFEKTYDWVGVENG